MSEQDSKFYYQQGDVIVEVDGSKRGKFVKTANAVLAEGEVTGHYHRIKGQDVEMDTMQKDSTLLLKVNEMAKLTHEEHKPQLFIPSEYSVEIVNEHDPFTGAINKVQD